MKGRKFFVSTSLLLFGLILGSLLTSHLGLFSLGQAVEVHREGAPLQVAVPPDDLFIDIAKRVTPAVVNISTTRVVKGREDDDPFNDPFFRRFFGDRPFERQGPPRQRRSQGLGSGVIVDPSGIIITNNHVVANADEVEVLLGDKREFKGKVIGSDPKSDLAIVKIDAENLPTVPWGDSDQLQVGEYVLAIGNPFGLNQTVTMGIVSAVGRANVGIADYEDFIQTDAAINPGNSGGALVNRRGELVGINTAIFSRTGGYMGIGFAVPSEMAKSIKESLVRTGKVTRGWLGVSIQEVTPQLAKEFGLKESKGALVSDVLPDSPAEAAGIERGDIVLGIDGKEVENTAQLRKWVAGAPVGEKIRLTLFRDKKEKEIELSLGEQPQEVAQAGGGEEAETSALKGAQVRNLTPEAAREMNLPKGLQGVVISRVEAGSLAEEAGLRAGDVILEVNRTAVRNTREYEKALSGLKKEQSALLLVHRGGNTLFVTLDAA
ncbi:DegQ family serine endoprotease [Candidatus Manganitrophus noduliformans]|uniref:DegQ family serine endoprotease n=1 Tax=Candidatus Manganitrophus noduliformans TaxID=2606439 RepID=A0A7X6DMW4_9BACT|nr:DegQ family serine endoprotease [Candidatus Manganitrophus noduliformans]NKE70094.1 DegQ family serine endoprotease [Candidatus Manganitrophus noduliformans]